MGINEKSMPLPKPKTKKEEARLRKFYDGPFYNFGPEGWEPWDDEPKPATREEGYAIIITIAFFFILLLSFLWLAACGIMHLVMCGG